MTNKDLETIKTWALAEFQKCVINRSDNDGLHMNRCFVEATLKLLNFNRERNRRAALDDELTNTNN